MNVLFVALGIHGRVGGIEAYCRRIMRCLGELSGTVVGRATVVALWDGADRCPEAPPGVRYLPGSSGKLRTAAAFLREARATCPDIVLYGHVLLAPLVVPGRWLVPRARHMLFAYGMEVWGDPAFRRVSGWERRLVRRRFDRVVSISRFTAGRMATAYGLSAGAFRFLPPAVDDAGPGAAGFADAPPTVLAVSRLRPEERTKGIDTLLRAMPAVLAAVPEARCRVVGDGPMRPELEALAASLGLRDRVTFSGYLPDSGLDRAYRESAVFAMPSSQEGFGIVYLEAWRHGLPVVAGNRDAGAEVVTNGETGLTVEPGSVDRLAEAIISLLRDPAARRRMGERGRAVLSEFYTHEAFRARFADVLADRGPA
ncbi:MAG: glycosyltransferase family 4 protein [Candidatus Coatesbacteria bacterium]